MEQIAKIFTGEITDWSEVGGDPGAISCIGRESGSGTRDGFESITGTKDSCKLDQELTSTGGVIEAVAGNPNAIGYASLSAVEGKDTVKAVTVRRCGLHRVHRAGRQLRHSAALRAGDQGRHDPVPGGAGLLRLRHLQGRRLPHSECGRRAYRQVKTNRGTLTCCGG